MTITNICANCNKIEHVEDYKVPHYCVDCISRGAGQDRKLISSLSHPAGSPYIMQNKGGTADDRFIPEPAINRVPERDEAVPMPVVSAGGSLFLFPMEES